MLSPNKLTDKCAEIKEILGDKNLRKISKPLTEIFDSHHDSYFKLHRLQSKMVRLIKDNRYLNKLNKNLKLKGKEV